LTTRSLSRLRTTSAFRAVEWLVGGYLVLSMLTVVAIITLSDVAPSLVSPQAQVRGIIVAATSVLTFGFANRAAKAAARARACCCWPQPASSSTRARPDPIRACRDVDLVSRLSSRAES
jgi:hypothetical protein